MFPSCRRFVRFWGIAFDEGFNNDYIVWTDFEGIVVFRCCVFKFLPSVEDVGEILGLLTGQGRSRILFVIFFTSFVSVSKPINLFAQIPGVVTGLGAVVDGVSTHVLLLVITYRWEGC